MPRLPPVEKLPQTRLRARFCPGVGYSALTFDLPMRLTFQGEALAGALVVAMNSRNPADKQSARSDAQGRVRFALRSGGLWLVKAVHMERAAVESDADWRSYWASLTFGVAEP